MPVEIKFLANVGGMLRDLREGRASLEAVGESVDNVRRDGAQGVHALERSFTELAESARRIEPDRNLAQPMHKATHEVSEGVADMRANTAQNLKETAASFDGSMQSMAGGAQGLLAELLEGFGPAGLIAGVAGAAGIGLLTTAMSNSDEAAAGAKQRVADLVDEMITAGTVGRRSLQGAADELQAMATGSDDGAVSLAKVREEATRLGVPFADLARAYAEGGDPLDNLIKRTRDLIGEESVRVARMSGGQAITSSTLQQLREQEGNLSRVRDETKRAAQAERDWLAAGGDKLQRKAQATQDYADSIQGALADAGTNWDAFKTKEGGIDLDKYLDVMRQKAQAVLDYQANMGRAAQLLNSDALAYIESLGVDAAPLLDQFVHAPEAKQDQLAAVWATLGVQAGAAFNAKLQNAFNNMPKPAPVDVVVTPILHPSAQQNLLAALQRQDYPVNVVPRAIAKPTFGSPKP